eukprot:XP_015575841.1 uncharacterized protein LOC107261401 isoform X1 [Ricinus communis]
MSKPVEVDNLVNVKEESVDSAGSYDLNISKLIDIDHYEVPGGYGFVHAMHLIVKENMKHMGEVVDYDAKKRWFKVVYENGISENVDRDEVDRIVVGNDLVEANPIHHVDVNSINPIEVNSNDPVEINSINPIEVNSNDLEPREQEEREAVVVGETAQTSPENRSPRREVQEEPRTEQAKRRGRKMGRPAAKPSTSPYVPVYRQKKRAGRGRKRGRPAAKPSTTPYVPLYKQTKRDAYYWY